MPSQYTLSTYLDRPESSDRSGVPSNAQVDLRFEAMMGEQKVFASHYVKNRWFDAGWIVEDAQGREVKDSEGMCLRLPKSRKGILKYLMRLEEYGYAVQP